MVPSSLRLAVERRLAPGFLAVLLMLLPACRTTDLRLWGSGAVDPGDLEIDTIRDVAYREGSDADDRHRVDLILPRGRSGYPVVVLVHGGAWMLGDNRCCGLYAAVGEFLARQGIGVVLPNYRLSPEVRHPEHARDVARVVAWTRSRIAGYGGDRGRIFLAGHSAGGHLVALLATDGRYLEKEGMNAGDLAGVMALSGVYRIPPGWMDVTLGGGSGRAFRLSQLMPVRGEGGGWGSPWGVPLAVNVFGPAFGDDPRERAEASPVNHVRGGMPPFLILSAENDLPTLAAMAEEFHERIQGVGGRSRLVRVERRNHNSILFRAIERGDPVAKELLGFIEEAGAGGAREGGMR